MRVAPFAGGAGREGLIRTYHESIWALLLRRDRRPGTSPMPQIATDQPDTPCCLPLSKRRIPQITTSWPVYFCPPDEPPSPARGPVMEKHRQITPSSARRSTSLGARPGIREISGPQPQRSEQEHRRYEQRRCGRLPYIDSCDHPGMIGGATTDARPRRPCFRRARPGRSTKSRARKYNPIARSAERRDCRGPAAGSMSAPPRRRPALRRQSRRRASRHRSSRSVLH